MTDRPHCSGPVVSIQDLHKSYGDVAVLRGVNLTIEQPGLTAVMGRSGSGKSTLLALIGALEKPDQGTIEVCGRDVHRLRGRRLDHFRNQDIAFIFQDHLLLPEFTAMENILMPALIGKGVNSAVKSFASELMTALDIADRKDHFPSQLSGGEQQRVAVARALINRPRLVLADEPTGNLDQANAEALHQLFVEFHQRYEISFLIATHNRQLARRCHQQWLLENGTLHPLTPLSDE